LNVLRLLRPHLFLLPVFTMPGAWWLLGDRILAVQVVGSLVVIVGVWFAIAPAGRRR
jgi:drug/metabolite transporter (DMT)-like permease